MGDGIQVTCKHCGAPERARELKTKGNTPLEIAHALNVSKRTVFRYIKT